MTLSDLKLKVLGDKHQIVKLDQDGTVVDSCDSLVDFGGLMGENVFECISGFMGLQEEVADLTAENPVLQLPLASIPELGGEAHHDITFFYSGDDEAVLLLITEMRAANESLRAMQQERNEASISLDHALNHNGHLQKYAHVVTHDLKAPLRAVGHLVDWMGEAIEESAYDRLPEYLTMLRGRARKMEGLIEGILGYSIRSSEGQSDSCVNTRDLVLEIIRDTEADLRTEILVAEDLPVIQGVPAAVRQVFANLISNAVHHGKPSHGTLSITAESEGGFHVFRVTDDGPGIDPARQGSIFGASASLPSSSSHAGSGLGLSIVSAAVRTAGGTVHVESELGKGATFVVRWPRTSSAGAAAS